MRGKTSDSKFGSEAFYLKMTPRQESDIKCILAASLVTINHDSAELILRSESGSQKLVEFTRPAFVEEDLDAELARKNGFVIHRKPIDEEVVIGRDHEGKLLIGVFHKLRKKLDEEKLETIRSLFKQAGLSLLVNFDFRPFPSKRKSSFTEKSIRFHNILHTMNQGVVYHDATGKIVYANPSAERILGLTHDQIFGKTSFDPDWRAIRENGDDFIGADHPATIALKKGRSVREVVMGIQPGKAKKITWIQIDAIPELDPDTGKVDQVMVTFSDITSFKEIRSQLEEKAGILRSIMESSSESIWSIDRSLRLRFANSKFVESCYKILGKPIHTGDYVIDYIDESRKEFWKEKFHRAIQGEFLEDTESYETAEGTKHFRMNVNPIFAGDQIIGASVFAKDVTELQNYYSTIQLHNERFREISWIQSHVIRAPLARLMGLLELISVDQDFTQEELNEFILMMKKASLEIDSLIREINWKSEELIKNKLPK